MREGGLPESERQTEEILLRCLSVRMEEQASKTGELEIDTHCRVPGLRELTSEDDTFLHMVKVARNPAILNIPTSVESQTDRQRYILVTIIPDVPLTYECNFPLMQTMGIMALFS